VFEPAWTGAARGMSLAVESDALLDGYRFMRRP